MKRKGFTLVELLAVIVILAIILAVAIPAISTIMDTSKRNAFESNAKMLLMQVDYKMLEDSSLNPVSINEANLETLLNISSSNYQTVSISTLNGKPYVILQGKNKWSDLVAYGTYTDMEVTDSSNYASIVNQSGYDNSKGVNEPKLAHGMIPIKWDGAKWVDTSASDTDWYSYDTTNKKWANARTTDGSMWVWIPRYIYKISTGWHSNTTGTIDIQFSKGIDDNWNSSAIGIIDTGISSNTSNNKWTNQPAFTFGNTKLTGIWVAKFEATAAEGVANGYNADGSCLLVEDNVTTKTIKSVPNATSWRCISVGNTFTNIRNMETNANYGWNIASGLQENGIFTTDTNNLDTHLMKNTEWGAVTYLSESIYGQGTNEIWINNSQTYTTGCAGTAVSSGAYSGCQNTYETANGGKASTTSNIYGVYDMSGGSWEYVAANVDNANVNLGQGSNIIGAAAQYKNVYTKGSTDDQANNYALTVNKKGDALWETSNNINGSYSWFSDYSYMPNTSNPWFLRGGACYSGFGAGAFSFSYTIGGTNSNNGFRPTLIVGEGL